MTDEILKLAKECGFSLDPSTADTFICGYEEQLEAFYKAAYNKGIEDAAKVCNQRFIDYMEPEAREMRNTIYELEKK